MTLHSQQPKRYQSLFNQKEPQRCLKSEGYLNAAFLAFLLEMKPAPPGGTQHLPWSQCCTRTNPAVIPANPSPYLAPLQSICSPESSPQPRDSMPHPFKVLQLLQQHHQNQQHLLCCKPVMGTSTAGTELLHRTELVSKG